MFQRPLDKSFYVDIQDKCQYGTHCKRAEREHGKVISFFLLLLFLIERIELKRETQSF